MMAHRVLHLAPMQPIEVRIVCGGWRQRLDPADGIEIWEGDHLVTTLPGAWLYDAVRQALSLAQLALPLARALERLCRRAPPGCGAAAPTDPAPAPACGPGAAGIGRAPVGRHERPD